MRAEPGKSGSGAWLPVQPHPAVVFPPAAVRHTPELGGGVKYHQLIITLVSSPTTLKAPGFECPITRLSSPLGCYPTPLTPKTTCQTKNTPSSHFIYPTSDHHLLNFQLPFFQSLDPPIHSPSWGLHATVLLPFYCSSFLTMASSLFYLALSPFNSIAPLCLLGRPRRPMESHATPTAHLSRNREEPMGWRMSKVSGGTLLSRRGDGIQGRGDAPHGTCSRVPVQLGASTWQKQL